MQFENDNHTNYNSHYAAAMYSSSSPSSTANPYYYETTTTTTTTTTAAAATLSPDNTSLYELDEYAPPNRLTFPANSKGPYQGNRKRPKRKQVKNACVNCQKACKKCDDGRPCQRCIKLGLTETCINSPRKERRKGVKRGPYKKRQYVSTSRYEDGDSQQPLSATTASASDWEEQQQAAYAAATTVPHLPNSIITPPLSQQDSPLHSSPLSSDVGYYGYPSGAAATAAVTAVVPVPDCASCSSPLSPDFPVTGWNDPHLLGMAAPPPPPHHHRDHHDPYRQISEPVLVQTLPSTHYEEQYPNIMAADPAECYYYNKPSQAEQYPQQQQQQQQQQQHSYYLSGDCVCTSCVQPPLSPSSATQMTVPWMHPQQRHQYPYPHYQPQQNSGYWQSFLSAN